MAAWVKNDHLGFEVLYIYRGVVHKYRPDFLIRLVSGEMLVLETNARSAHNQFTTRDDCCHPDRDRFPGWRCRFGVGPHLARNNSTVLVIAFVIVVWSIEILAKEDSVYE